MAFACKHKISDKILANCSPYFTALQYINNLETKRSYKRKVNLKTLKFLKNLSSGSKLIGLFAKADRNVCKTANKSASIHANQILLSSNRLAIGYLHNLSHTFLKRLKLLWGEIACQNASFSKETAEHQDCPFLTVFFFNHKKS